MYICNKLTYNDMEYKICNLKPFENLYYIYENGDIYSLSKQKMLIKQINGTHYQYIYVTLSTKQHVLRTSVHRLVAHHFICPEPEKHPILGRYEVDHIDGNKFNNHYTNLRWITHSLNIKDAMNRKKWSCGRVPGFKLSEESKQKMRIKKYKKVLLFNDNEHIIYDSCEQVINLLNVCRKTFNRYANSNRTINGFKIKILQ